MTNQLTNRSREVGLMKNNNIRKLWIEFLIDKKYEMYFQAINIIYYKNVKS